MSGSMSRSRQRVFVDVPPSPFPLSRYSSLSRKENAPLTTPSLLFRKRKLSETNTLSIGSTKKQKLTAGTPLKTSALPPLASAPNVSADFPNGSFYCHQCSRKRDISGVVHCTMKQTIALIGRSTKEQRCKVKLCRTCLKNRYGEDLDVMIAQKSSGRDKEHVNTENYIFKCPKCRNICTCFRCRKPKNSEASTSFTNVARKTGVGSVSQHPSGDCNTVVDKVPGEGKHVERRNKPKVKATLINCSTSPAPSTKGSSQTKVLHKAIPVPKWIEIPGNLDLKEAGARFGIREFMLRFASIMQPPIAKVHLMELEDISGTCPEDEDGMAGWVSEACVRAIILGILGLLAKQDNAKSIITAIKDIRTTGTNLNKIWAILSRFCTANHVSHGETHLSIPNPLPPPISAVMHNTRTMRSNRDSNGTVSIVQSAQMIPVVEALMEAAIHLDTIRDELDNGVRNGKDLTKTIKEFCRKENEKWEAERKAIKALVKNNDKTKGDQQMKINLKAQQRHIWHLENALKLALPGCAPRFAPLGTDKEGRMFWTLSPGIAERNAALDFITAATSESGETGKRDTKSRGATRRPLDSGEERNSMKQWSWFVAIWGKKPFQAKKFPQTHTDDEDNGPEVEDAKRWWAVCEPEEIRKVAQWVAMTSGLPGEGSSSLVKGLNDYAALLEWRLLEDKFDGSNAGGDTND